MSRNLARKVQSLYVWRTVSNGLCRTERVGLIMRAGNNADGRKMRKGPYIKDVRTGREGG